MLIVTRPDGSGHTHVVNLAVVERVFTAPHRKPGGYTVHAETSASDILMGTYATIERCTEVLMEIIKEYETYHAVPNQNTMMRPWAFDPPKVYRMPED